MDREILYRAKCPDSNEWVYGAYIPQWGEIATFDAEGQDCTIPVDGDTAGEYTGIKDRNGKRIFEGDICIWVDNDGEYDANCKYVVSWEQEETGFCLQIYDNGEDCGLDYFGDGRDGLEIVGNIYDNPELLNGTSLLVPAPCWTATAPRSGSDGMNG